MSLADFEIVTTTAGVLSIRNKIVNEIMHNPVGPWKEANELYIDQSRFKERLLKNDPSPLVLFDVGLGAAANALAALHCIKSLVESDSVDSSRVRNLHIISFENNLSLLEFALLNSHHFPSMHDYREAMRTLLDKDKWVSPCKRITWELRHGDYLDFIKRETTPPELVFFDPYSPSKNRDMWSLSSFESLFALVRTSNKAMSLFTYSIATPVRAAMLMAGFYVGYGKATGLKVETTQAATCLEELIEPLNARWWSRWNASHTKMPYDVLESEEAAFKERILSHPQFKEFQTV